MKFMQNKLQGGRLKEDIRPNENTNKYNRILSENEPSLKAMRLEDKILICYNIIPDRQKKEDNSTKIKYKEFFKPLLLQIESNPTDAFYQKNQTPSLK